MVIAAAALCHRRAAELAAPNDQSFVEQSALLEVGDERGAGLVGIAALITEVAHQRTVLVPTAMEQLNRTDGDLADRTIYFEYDSAKLSSESIVILETHGNFIAGNGEVKVRLEGHGDERGSREYNIALGDRRAQSVRRVLLFQGASSDQVETVSYGEEKPMESGHDDAAWSKNRRVELIYTVN